MSSYGKPLKADHERRFGGVARLYGQAGAERIFSAHVGVIGVGGVGSWVAEALARSGIGQMTLIDLDMVAESNTNRQIHALSDQYGKAKVSAMAERIHLINPSCQINCIEDFLTTDNMEEIFSKPIDFVVDAIDQTKVKASLIAHCKKKHIPLVVAGAAGGQFDPTKIQLSDLSQTTQDPLLARVRSLLRRDHAFPRNPQRKFGITAIFSTEQLHLPESSCQTGKTSLAGLNCAGYGSSICVTASFGFAAAAHVLKKIADI